MVKRWVLCLLAVFCMLFSSIAVFADNADSSQSDDIPIDDDVPKIETDDSTVNIGDGGRDKEFGIEQEDNDETDYFVEVTKTISIFGELYTITTNVPEQSQIICVCYQRGRICAMSVMPKTLVQDTYFFIPDKPHQAVKVMVFENLDTLCPIIEPVFVE